MGDYIVLDGDTVMFDTAFMPGVTVTPLGVAKTKGSGPATLSGIKVCVVGDEANTKLNCQYFTAQYPLPGQGELTIKALAGDQQATKTQSGDAKVILVGSKFDAELKVMAGAKLTTPSGPQLDSTVTYSGKGSFMTTNTKFTGT